MPPPNLTPAIKTIQGVRLARRSSSSNLDIETFTIAQANGIITSVVPSSSPAPSTTTTPPLALPALVHPHIHLDKAFIHSSPSYQHLLPSTGTFSEALTSTTTAKSAFTTTDLLHRGEWLLSDSVSAGVTAMRAFVEVDHTVQHTCLAAASILKANWEDICTIQLVCFAQDPIFSTPHAPENLSFLESALTTSPYAPDIDVIGTTPYVETSLEAAKENIRWAVQRALALDKHLDFHLDYNLRPESEPLIWFVLQTLKESRWTVERTSKRVMLGHCTRLTLLTDQEWLRIADEIHRYRLPVSFVGLPTSDLYMAAPPPSSGSSACGVCGGGAGGGKGTVRGTLHVPDLIRRYGLDVVMGVNNVGNAFTPWGSADPLSLACLGVGIYQTGTQSDAALLFECVSTRARAAIGLSAPGDESRTEVKEGDCADLLLLYDVDDTGCGVSRPRKSVAEVVWDPPSRISRVVVSRGRAKIPPLGACPDTTFDFVEGS